MFIRRFVIIGHVQKLLKHRHRIKLASSRAGRKLYNNGKATSQQMTDTATSRTRTRTVTYNVLEGTSGIRGETERYPSDLLI